MAYPMQPVQQSPGGAAYPAAGAVHHPATSSGAGPKAKAAKPREEKERPKVKPGKVRQSLALKVLAQAAADPADANDRKDEKVQKPVVSSLEQLTEKERQNIVADIN